MALDIFHTPEVQLEGCIPSHPLNGSCPRATWPDAACQALTVVLRRGHVHCKEEAGNGSPTGDVFDCDAVHSRNRRAMFVLVQRLWV